MIKHNKKKNIGIIFDILTKKFINEYSNKNYDKVKNIISIIKKHFNNKSELLKELKLFNTILYGQLNNWQTASRLLEEVLSSVEKLDNKKIITEKFNLLGDIYKHYNKEEFFNEAVEGYKIYASIYQLMENRRNPKNLELIDKVKLEEAIVYHLLDNTEIEKVNNFMKLYENSVNDKQPEVDDFVYNIAVMKFNKKYETSLSQEQKNILKEYLLQNDPKFITSAKRKIENSLYNLMKISNNKELSEKLYKSITVLDNIFNLKEDKQVEMLLMYQDLIEQVKNYKSSK